MTVPAESDSTRRSGRRWPAPATGIGLFVALFGLVLFDWILTALGSAPTTVQIVLAKWGLTGVLLWIVLRGEGRSLASIGLRRPDRWDLASAFAITIVGFLSLAVTAALVERAGLDTAIGSEDAVATSIALAVFLVPLTSGVTEELWFRGYALERLESISGSVWVAAVATAAVFLLIHLPSHGVGGVLVIAPLTVVLTLGYVWRRNVLVVIFAHVLINAIGGIAAIFAS